MSVTSVPPVTSFTIFRRTRIDRIDAAGNRSDTRISQDAFLVPGGTAEAALDGLLSSLAEADGRKTDPDPGDDEYELWMATDGVAGEFAVYEGALETRPDTAPLLVAGEIGDPVHRERAAR